jgi:hypothetical protein
MLFALHTVANDILVVEAADLRPAAPHAHFLTSRRSPALRIARELTMPAR